jgi:hypothetical protein
MPWSHLGFAFFALSQAKYFISFRGTTMCARKAHVDIGFSVPKSVPKRDPTTILRQPTPTNKPRKNGPEIIDFRPVL